MKAFCTAKDWHVQEAHSDADLSGGRADNRPGLQGALSTSIESSKDAPTALVVYSLSRLARNTRDALAISDQLKAAGVSLVSLSESIDTSTPAGNLFFTILSAVCQWEREETGSRTSAAMKRYQENGRRMGRYAPYGYAIDSTNHSKLVAIEPEQETIFEIIKLYRRNLKLPEIAAELKKQGRMKRNGTAFWIPNIKEVLARKESHVKEQAKEIECIPATIPGNDDGDREEIL